MPHTRTDEKPTARQAEFQLRATVMTRAHHACEGSPKHPFCRAREGEEHPDTGKTTALAMIRLEPGSTDPAECRALCTRCVLSFEFPRHKNADWRESRAATGNLELFPIEPKS